MRKKRIYFFGGGRAEGDASMKAILGGKGAGLAEMVNLGIPVPPGFTISTGACLEYYEDRGRLIEELKDELHENLKRLEDLRGGKFGDPSNPLLLAARSGAWASMPGMMDTILNIGLNRDTIEGLQRKTGNPRFALDCYRRFLQMYGNVVLGIHGEVFEQILSDVKAKHNLRLDTELTEEHLGQLIERYRAKIDALSIAHLPDDPLDQLWGAIEAVFRSWNNPRAATYRAIHNIPSEWGTAANIQSMVFGNMGLDCATGVAFTRSPSTGDKMLYGEYLTNAQGEDVVAGIRTPNRIDCDPQDPFRPCLKSEMPRVHEQFVEIYEKLERHFRDMLDIEFTVEKGKLYILQVRSGKRTGLAAVNIAVDMVAEGLIDKEEAIRRFEAEQITQLLAGVFDPEAKKKALREGCLLTEGLNAGPGAASGMVVFSAEKAVDMVHNKREKVILVRKETSAEDIAGMSVAEGILTSRGGMTSHAAVVARGMGKSCVVGAGEIEVDYDQKVVRVGNRKIEMGEYISLDGFTGEVILGQLTVNPSEIYRVAVEGSIKAEDSVLYQKYSTLLSWADQLRRLKVRTNADTPEDAAIARSFGAEGIGLCRTEHMFFAEERIRYVHEMIIAETTEERKKALKKLKEMQKDDFRGIFRAMRGLPVTIRLIDPPLHEFLPTDPAVLEALAREKGIPISRIHKRVEELKEANPMLGHRGVRLLISYPEIYEMQVEAIIEAAIEVAKDGFEVHPEIMIPLVSTRSEIKAVKDGIVGEKKEIIARGIYQIATEMMCRMGKVIPFTLGTMIELPRAALVADEIAKEAEFFSFGTNDLTQMTFGFSRDDAQRSFLPVYKEKGILGEDPFKTIDIDGVGQLIRMGVEKGRQARKDLKIGICGEHGGDPKSVEFCHRAGLNYVSCSGFRVPVARLAAARAAVLEKSHDV